MEQTRAAGDHVPEYARRAFSDHVDKRRSLPRVTSSRSMHPSGRTPPADYFGLPGMGDVCLQANEMIREETAKVSSTGRCATTPG